MRLSYGKKFKITDNILADLYGTLITNLDVRKSAIAERNCQYELEPYQAIINSLPESLLAHADNYILEVGNISEAPLSEKLWVHTFNKPTICFINYSTNTKTSYSLRVDPRLVGEATALTNEIVALHKEKEIMEEYLKTTMKTWSGTIQLRKIWPESLHKYLPAEEMKTHRIVPAGNGTTNVKAVKPGVPEVPNLLNTRLTTNLLEGI
jgi:hypothetical protein